MSKPHHRILAVSLALWVAVSPVAPAYAQAPTAGREAGAVTAQIPQGTLTRPGEQKPTVEGEAVLWDDLVQTTERGRVRITLGDTSVLNVGSNSTLRVTRHNAATRQTELELTVGKMRSRLQRLDSRQGQKFEIKTSTAVIGAVGTDFFVEATPRFTRVIVYEGAVLVTGLGAAVAASQTLLAGNQATVFPEQPPSSPQPASRADVQHSMQETEVGEPLPSPFTTKPSPRLLAKKWPWIAAVAGAAVTTTVVVVTTRKKREVTGCPVPLASSSSMAVTAAAATCPP